MSRFSSDIVLLRNRYEQAKGIEERIDVLTKQLAEQNQRYADMLEAQQLLTTVSDNNTTVVLDYITGIINKTLAEILPHDSRRIFLEKTMHKNRYAHINVKLTGSNGKTRDLALQTGTGIRQVISYLFAICLIEIRKGRRLFIADELLSGLHPEAKRVITEVIKIFAEDGFQFIMVEYGLNNLERLYLVEKPGAVATVTPLDGVYGDEVFKFNPPEGVDLDVAYEA